jgi:diacylglycerol O-acyltransferase / wax synthase
MEQLSGLDSLFLFAENENLHQHVSAFGIYDTTGLNGEVMRFRDLLTHFERRLMSSKIFRRRLLMVPHELDRPYWVEDADLDVEFHVRHIALPHPGDRRQLMIQLARLHSRALDMSKPLWEIYVIEGLENIDGLPPGSFAIFLKVHHAALDTAAALRIVADIHSASHDNDMPGEVVISEREPSPVTLYGKMLGNNAQRMLRGGKLYAQFATRLAQMGARTLLDRLRTEPPGRHLPRFLKAPHTRFNRPVGPNRVVDVVQLPLARVHEIRQQSGKASVDDVYLAVVSGALRNYLKTRNELPEVSLRALFSLRLAHQGQPSARASRLPMSLATHLRDPVARLHAIRDEVQALYDDPLADLSRKIFPDFLAEIPNVAAHALMQRLIFDQVNCIVTNLRGPSEPMLLAGARALQFCPVGMLAEKVGLHINGFSYDGQLTISFTACRAILPDPALFAAALEESFEELAAAAARRQATGQRRKAGRQSGHTHVAPTPDEIPA